MKIRLQISDPLLAEVKTLAVREGTTVRALVDEGLRHVVRARRPTTTRRPTTARFRLRDASVSGRPGPGDDDGTLFLDALGLVNDRRR